MKLQDYLITSLSRFMNQTGAIGFAWDYTFFSDKRHSIYSQWKGWQRVTNTLRKLHPDMVCDNRQNAHMWGPWYHSSGSYSEPVAGDENPETSDSLPMPKTLASPNLQIQQIMKMFRI